MHQNPFSAGSAPNPAGGAYDAPPDPLGLPHWEGDTPSAYPSPLDAFGVSVLRPPSTHNPGYASACSQQPRTVQDWTVRRHWLQAKAKCQWGLQQLCNSCASLAGLVLSFIACFILLVIVPLRRQKLNKASCNACMYVKPLSEAVV